MDLQVSFSPPNFFNSFDFIVILAAFPPNLPLLGVHIGLPSLFGKGGWTLLTVSKIHLIHFDVILELVMRVESVIIGLVLENCFPFIHIFVAWISNSGVDILAKLPTIHLLAMQKMGTSDFVIKVARGRNIFIFLACYRFCRTHPIAMFL